MPDPPARALSATSRCSLDTSRDGSSTTSLGSPFQCLTTFPMKEFLLLSTLDGPWPSSCPGGSTAGCVAGQGRCVLPAQPGRAGCHGSALLRSPTFSSPQPESHKCQQTSWVQKALTAFIKRVFTSSSSSLRTKLFSPVTQSGTAGLCSAIQPGWRLQLCPSRTAASQSPFFL